MTTHNCICLVIIYHMAQKIDGGNIDEFPAIIVNVFPIKIFHLVSYLATADKFVAIRLHSNTEAPSLENHNIQSSLSYHNYLILIKVMLYASQFHASVNHIVDHVEGMHMLRCDITCSSQCSHIFCDYTQKWCG